MADRSLTLTSDEGDCLVELLEMLLKETQIEEHRTRTLSYRENVIRREALIKSVLTKLGKPPA
jgi:hypothetical protein